MFCRPDQTRANDQEDQDDQYDQTCQQNWNFTKTEMSLKIICQQKWNFPKTEMSLKFKCHQIEMLLKLKHN